MWLHFECSAPYRPNLPFLISDIRALWCSGLSARMSEIKNGRLGLYGKVQLSEGLGFKGLSILSVLETNVKSIGAKSSEYSV